MTSARRPLPDRHLFRLAWTAALVCALGSSLPAGSARAFSIAEPANLLDTFYSERPVDYLVPEIVTLGVNDASNGQGCINFGCADAFDSFRFQRSGAKGPVPSEYALERPHTR